MHVTTSTYNTLLIFLVNFFSFKDLSIALLVIVWLGIIAFKEVQLKLQQMVLLVNHVQRVNTV